MPIIPTYDPKYGIPSVDFPEVSPKAASLPAEAAIETTKSGIQALQMQREGQKEMWKGFEVLNEKLNDLFSVNQVTKIISDTQLELNQLKNSTLQDPLWNSDPEQALKQYNQKVQEIIGKGQPFVMNPKARERLDSSLATISTSSINHMNDMAFGQKMRIGQAGLLDGLEGLHRSATLNQDWSEFQENHKQAFASIDAAVSAGILHPDQGMKLRQHWVDQAMKSFAKADIMKDPYGAVDKIRTGWGPYGMMDADERYGFLESAQHKIDGIERRIEMNEAKAEREAVKQERIMDRKAREVFRNADDALASIVEFGEEGPVDIEERLRAMGTETSVELADEYSRRKKVAIGTFRVMQNAQGKPFRDQLDYVEEAFRTTPGEPGAKEKIQAREYAVKVVQQGMKKFLDDPAGYVAGIVKESEDKDETPEKSIDRSLEMQKAMGEGLPGFRPTIFSKNYAKQFTERWASMENPDEKLKFVRELDQFGKYRHQAMSELGLGADAMLAKTVDEASASNAVNAKTLIQAGGMKESEIPGDPKTKTSIKNSMRSKLEGSAVWNALTGAVKLQPMNSNQVRFMREIETGLVNSAMLYGDPERAMTILENTYQAVNRDDLGKLVYPKSYPLSAGEMERALFTARKGVSEFLSGQKTVLGQALFDEKMRDLTNRGIWVNDPSGEGFVLLNPQTGLAVTNENGARFKVTTDDLIRINKLPKETIDFMFPAESPRGLLGGEGKTMIRKPIPKQKLLNLSRDISEREGIDFGLVRSVIQAESNWDTEAKSPEGAIGLMQLMPGTAKDMGVSDPYDPEQNMTGGVKYLSSMLDRYGGDKVKALVAYNWGPKNADRWDGRLELLPNETRNYLKKIGVA